MATSSLAKDLGLPVRKNNWYIVADTDILLLDYELIDNLVLSDPKCKLIIPHAVRVDIESLCIGDCHGQQRVIQARQIARKLATPPPHYTVEPPPIDKKDEIIVTTDCILNCCLHAKNQNYYVVLISNDPHLQCAKRSPLFRRELNIRAGKFKAFISPEFFMKMFRYGVMLISTLKIILPNSEELNDAELNLNDLLSDIESNANEIDLESLRTPSVSRADTDDRVKVVFTKEKSYVLDYLKKHYKEWASYKEECIEKVLNTQEVNRPDLQVVRTSGKNLNLVKIISNKAICLQNPTESDAANDKNQSKDIRLIDNRQLNESYSNLAITEPKLMELCEDNSENISKINDENNLHSKDTKEIEKNYTTPTKSVCIENTDLSNPATEIDGPKMVRNTTVIDEYEKKVQNREPLDMDLLDYSEIYEPSVAENPEFDIIEEKQINNNNHFENYNKIFTENVTENVPLDTIFQTEDNLDNIFDTNDDRKTENTVEHILPTNSGNEHSSETGNTIQNIDEKTTNKKSTDKNLSNNDCCVDNPEIGTASNDICVDNPEIGTASNDCCVENPETGTASNDCCVDNPEIGTTSFEKSDQVLAVSPNDSGIENDSTYAYSAIALCLNKVSVTKEKSYVLDYLKKHFKEWASYKEECIEKVPNTQEINRPDLQVVRTSGKNLNLVKIISNKAMCLQNPTESDAANDKNKSEVIRLIDNRQLNESYSNLAITEPKLMELCEDNSENISKINDENNLHSKDTKEIEKNYTTPTKSVCIENTDLSNPATEIDGPKMVRNTTVIDEYEKKVQNREPLDMDLLDYSEIYEPSVAENPEFDIIEEKQINNNNHFENYNKIFTENVTENLPLETIFQTEENLDNIFNTNDDRKTENNVEHTLPTKSGNEHSSETGNTVQNIDEKTTNEKTTDKNLTKNDCCVDNPEIGTTSNDICVDNPEIGTANNDCCVENPETGTANNDCCVENPEIGTTSFEKSDQVLAVSPNDSGIENDSTYAYSAIALCLNKVSGTLIELYKFM
ncbi:hypothetical protein B5X24_HaOG213616 [Helicoverpa armigera]|uniref:PIN domain-containing protein n=1 Tax=Helicoverpa armigera TaxID=29058 RepID=A0A2W1B910_HELAM|nr:hypothetical protein B5X24_HaOG213616 [Helicoverpa armigera]